MFVKSFFFLTNPSRAHPVINAVWAEFHQVVSV